MMKLSRMAVLSALLITIATTAEARKVPGNPLEAPVLLDSNNVTGECDGDELTVDDACVEVTFTKVCGAVKYPVEVSKGFDTDSDGCNDATISEDTTVVAEACTGINNCIVDLVERECQTALVPVGTTTMCVDDGDLNVDCVGDLEDVLVEATSVCSKVKATNPAQKGPKAVSQSTPFSNTDCSDINDECF